MIEKSYEESNRVKYNHLIKENSALLETVKEFSMQIESLRKINKKLLQSNENTQKSLIQEMDLQNNHLQSTCMRISQLNSELSCSILLKDQLICEMNNQHSQITSNYEEKISQLMELLQNKQECLKKIQMKRQQQIRFGATNTINLSYFVQVNDLIQLNMRQNIENLQLKYILAQKEAEIEQYKDTGGKTSKEKNHQKKPYAKCKTENAEPSKKKKKQGINLEFQIEKYEKQFKETFTKKMPNYVLSDVKLMINHLNYENMLLIEDKNALIREKKQKNLMYNRLQESYKTIAAEYARLKVQVDFYKNNFKQLNKVTTQRKIQYYLDHFEESLPNLQRRVNDKKALIDYWKGFHRENLLQRIQCKGMVRDQDKLPKALYRSNSCSSRFRPFLQRRVQQLSSLERQSAILSFILDINYADLVSKGHISNGSFNFASKIFKEDISIISPFKKNINDYQGELNDIDLNE